MLSLLQVTCTSATPRATTWIDANMFSIPDECKASRFVCSVNYVYPQSYVMFDVFRPVLCGRGVALLASYIGDG